jgi:hypothetical protein
MTVLKTSDAKTEATIRFPMSENPPWYILSPIGKLQGAEVKLMMEVMAMTVLKTSDAKTESTIRFPMSENPPGYILSPIGKLQGAKVTLWLIFIKIDIKLSILIGRTLNFTISKCTHYTDFK